MKKVILSLFDYSGNWSKPYKAAGFEIVQIDIKLGIDILNWNYKVISKDSVFGILAAVPCTHFSKVSAHNWSYYDQSGKTEKSLKLLLKTLEIIEYFNPEFWVIENPPGRIEKLVPELKQFRLLSFQPYEFGDPYSKNTILWGKFNPFLSRNVVPKSKRLPTREHDNSVYYYNSKLYPGKSKSELRSITPPGFSQAFFQANH